MNGFILKYRDKKLSFSKTTGLIPHTKIKNVYWKNFKVRQNWRNLALRKKSYHCTTKNHRGRILKNFISYILYVFFALCFFLLASIILLHSLCVNLCSFYSRSSLRILLLSVLFSRLKKWLFVGQYFNIIWI